MSDRRTRARELRHEAADEAHDHHGGEHVNNGEEVEYGPVANFSKGLPHDAVGLVLPKAYAAMRKALASGEADDFEAIPLGTSGGRKFTSPQAGLAFDLEGPDAHSLTLKPAPRLDSAENSSEMGELYWMAALRDVAFQSYSTNPTAASAGRGHERVLRLQGTQDGRFGDARARCSGAEAQGTWSGPTSRSSS